MFAISYAPDWMRGQTANPAGQSPRMGSE